MVNHKFEGITPLSIINSANQKVEADYIHAQPKEILKTKYISGQTIILQGNKSVFESLIHFWLSTQYWYGSDGEDAFYNTLVIDNISGYTSWQEDPNRVGICQIANKLEKQRYDSKIASHLGINANQEYLIMNPSWNEEKVLFTDHENYYLYFFWTGE